jgi:hypothetical protein
VVRRFRGWQVNGETRVRLAPNTRKGVSEVAVRNRGLMRPCDRCVKGGEEGGKESGGECE